MNIVKMYPSKLDSVTDLTIKRLRYSSENGKKVLVIIGADDIHCVV